MQLFLHSPGIKIFQLLPDLFMSDSIDFEIVDITELIFGVISPDE